MNSLTNIIADVTHETRYGIVITKCRSPSGFTRKSTFNFHNLIRSLLPSPFIQWNYDYHSIYHLQLVTYLQQYTSRCRSRFSLLHNTPCFYRKNLNIVYNIGDNIISTLYNEENFLEKAARNKLRLKVNLLIARHEMFGD